MADNARQVESVTIKTKSNSTQTNSSTMKYEDFTNDTEKAQNLNKKRTVGTGIKAIVKMAICVFFFMPK